MSSSAPMSLMIRLVFMWARSLYARTCTARTVSSPSGRGVREARQDRDARQAQKVIVGDLLHTPTRNHRTCTSTRHRVGLDAVLLVDRVEVTQYRHGVQLVALLSAAHAAPCTRAPRRSLPRRARRSLGAPYRR